MNTVSRMIWQNVEELLNAKGWSLAELARKAGMSPQHLNAIKTGEKGIGEQTLQGLAKALNTPSELLIAPSIDDRLARIANALERIANALER